MENRQTIIKILEEIRPDVDFENEKDLTGDGLLESLDLITLVQTLMFTFDIQLGVEDLTPENFASADSICELVERHMA